MVDTIYLSATNEINWLGGWYRNLLDGVNAEYVVVPFSQQTSGNLFNTSRSRIKHVNLNYLPCNAYEQFSNGCIEVVSLPKATSWTPTSTYLFYCAPHLKRLRFDGDFIGNRGSFYQNGANEITATFVSDGGSLSSFVALTCLEKFYISENCTSLYNYDFLSDCCSLEDIYIYAPTPPTRGNYQFIYRSKNFRIHVPAESLETYKTATNWTTLADYMVGDL